MVRILVIICLAATLLDCSSSDKSVAPVDAATNEVITIEYADSLWALRADTSNAQNALIAYRKLSESDSSSISYWSKLSKAYYFCAQYLSHSATKRDSLFMEGYETSQTILNQNESYRNLLFSTGEESMAVRGLDIGAIDALYWGMANYGQWLTTKGELVRIGQRDMIWTTLEHINDLDSNYYYGAYYRYKGALQARDPKFQADTEIIREAFEKAIELAPDYLGNYTLMARYYCPLSKDKDLFYQLLTRVVTAQPNQNLPYYPENLYERELAERLMIKAEKENWFNL